VRTFALAAVLAVSMLVLAQPAATATRSKLSGKSLLVLCEHRDELIYTACLTYIAGATDLVH
jgi:hypothetical protein